MSGMILQAAENPIAQQEPKPVPQTVNNAPAADPQAQRRINVVFSQQQYNTLVSLAQMQNITLSAALRQAINISDFIVRANADKDTQILLKKGNNIQELKIVR